MSDVESKNPLKTGGDANNNRRSNYPNSTPTALFLALLISAATVAAAPAAEIAAATVAAAPAAEIAAPVTTFEPRGITPQDTIVFVLGCIPFAVATNEFWRRIVNGEDFGTGKDRIKIDEDLYEKLIVDGADEDQLRRAGGRRVLGADAMFAARVLFTLAGASLALTAYATFSEFAK